MEESFLTTEEVLDYLRVNLRTVYRLVKARKIPAVRVGRQWRFRKSDLDVWLESRQAWPAAPEAGNNASRPASQNRPRVLVVEDEAGVREVLSRGLSFAEYQVDAVPDGEGALQRLRAGFYDLMIVDLNLPDTDGIAIVREARKLSPTTNAIIVTGNSTEQAAIEAANLGVKAYLTKPFRMSQVLIKVAKALGEPPTG